MKSIFIKICYKNNSLELIRNNYIIFVSDCLISDDLHFSYRIGDHYGNDLRKIVDTYSGDNRLDSYYSSNIELWIDETDNYKIDSVSSVTEGNDTYITVNLTTLYDNYGTINVSFDFDFDINMDRRTFVSFETSGRGYYLLINDKSNVNLKAIPGKYNLWGWTRTIRVDDARFRPTVQSNSFAVSSGSSVDVHVIMQPN